MFEWERAFLHPFHEQALAVAPPAVKSSGRIISHSIARPQIGRGLQHHRSLSIIGGRRVLGRRTGETHPLNPRRVFPSPIEITSMIVGVCGESEAQPEDP